MLVKILAEHVLEQFSHSPVRWIECSEGRYPAATQAASPGLADLLDKIRSPGPYLILQGPLQSVVMHEVQQVRRRFPIVDRSMFTRCFSNPRDIRELQQVLDFNCRRQGTLTNERVPLLGPGRALGAYDHTPQALLNP